MRARMLSRIRTDKHKWCDECRDSDPIQPHDLVRFPRLRELPSWWWEHQERGGYSQWHRRRHRKKMRHVEKRALREEIQEELDDYMEQKTF